MTGPGLNVPLNDPRMPALRRLRPPAFVMMCVGSLNIMFCLMVLLAWALKAKPFGLDPQEAFKAQPVLVLLTTIVGSLVAGALSIWGALSAVSLRSWGLVVVGALTAILPLSPACCLGVPTCGWMLWTINDPKVKEHFR